MSDHYDTAQSNAPPCSDIPNSPCSSTSHTIKLYQAVVFGLPVLFTAILLVLFCIFYLRRRRAAQNSLRLRAQIFAGGGFTVSAAEGGLCKVFRDALPVIVYDDKFVASNGDNQCPVCLNEFEPNEKLRKLPVCGHCFHLDCIDEWIQSNSSCPVCRSTLIKTSKVVPSGVHAQQEIGLTQSAGGENSGWIEAAKSTEPSVPQSSGVSGSTKNAVHEVANAAANV